ncbi:unnamed protein product [Bursaphelenchus okinawaensis]|uniref:Radical SAM core domain-containing protein n=1 Tax=Bursaphelenchus okinawaensis TaxID=465554 RepID=A0A811L4H5_9BILA|nr:unnamed protein product [Bursaphelenchus okinawaensis]CAG9116572.1 unnamed protein product [Bursaphelenchus okinawaensis]
MRRSSSLFSNYLTAKVLNRQDHPLVDKFGRYHSYLRISLTEKCNLRCTYCMPEEGVDLTPSNKLLTKHEIIKLVRLFAQNGVDKVRLTGGEPTIRADLEEIIREIRDTKMINEIGITSNGIVLKRKLKKLVDAGLNRLNLSLDTLDENKYMIITRRNGFNKVMGCIDEALPLFERVKLNCVVTRGVNDMEVLDFVELTRHKSLDIRFIEYMPFGGNKFDSKKMVSFKEMMVNIAGRYDQAFKVNGYEGQFGFITSMSTPFCSTCNRLRITADGMSSWKHGNESEGSHEKRSIGPRTFGHNWKYCIQKESGSRWNGSFGQATQSPNDQNRRLSGIGYQSFKSLVRHYSTLSHIDEYGKASMVDVSHKQIIQRVARAAARVIVTDEIMIEVRENKIEKGDIIATARLAGIMAAKKTSNLIPLCHQLNLSNVKIYFQLSENNILIESECKCNGETGVEMEALTAVSVAALTVYDMCKALSHHIVISDIRLISKSGGKTHLRLNNK